MKVSSVFSSIDQEKLYPCVVGTKIGYKSLKDLSIRIPAQFDEAYKFHQDRALVRIDKKWGFIDINGNMIISPRFWNASHFYNGYSLVKNTFDYFSHPYLINKEGEIYRGIDYSKYYLLSPINEGLIAAQRLTDEKCGLLDINGNEIIPFIYTSFNGIDSWEKSYNDCIVFENGYASVNTQEEDFLYIDKEGKRIFPESHSWSDTRLFGSNLKVTRLSKVWREKVSWLKTIEHRTNIYGIFNQNGIQIGQDYDYIGDLIDNRAVFKIYNHEKDEYKYGYLNEKGEVIIPAIFNSANDFKDGLAHVGIGKYFCNYGYCDIWGNSTIDHLRQ